MHTWAGAWTLILASWAPSCVHWQLTFEALGSSPVRGSNCTLGCTVVFWDILLGVPALDKVPPLMS